MDKILGLTILILCCSYCKAVDLVNSTQIKIESDSGLKNYEEEEDGKVLPYR